jgi:uncharacterized DUF497 family protein
LRIPCLSHILTLTIQNRKNVILSLGFLVSKYRILVISHTYRSKTIRIISARQATKRERRFYEHGN